MNTVVKPPFGAQLRYGHWSTRGLVAYYPFTPAGNLVDFSMGRKHGVITGAAWAGDGLAFAADTDEVNLGTSYFGIDQTQQFTLVFSVKFTSFNDDVIFSRSVFNNPWRVMVDTSRLNFGTKTVTTDTDYSPFTGTLTAGRWYIFAYTFNNGIKNLYQDGLFVGTNTVAGALVFDSTAHSFTFGQPYDNIYISERFHLRDLKVYNRTLSAGEIRQLYLNPNLPIATFPWELFAGQGGGAPPAGLSIPVAMHHYNQLRCA